MRSRPRWNARKSWPKATPRAVGMKPNASTGHFRWPRGEPTRPEDGTASGAFANIRVFETAPEAQRAAAELLVASARAGEHLALSGGGAPRHAFGVAAEPRPDRGAAEI